MLEDASNRLKISLLQNFCKFSKFDKKFLKSRIFDFSIEPCKLGTSDGTVSELRVDFGKIDSIGFEGLISISGSGIAWVD